MTEETIVIGPPIAANAAVWGSMTGNALLPIALYVTNLAQRKTDNADFVGVKVAVPGAIPADGLLLAGSSDPWKAQLARSLSDIAGGAGTMGFELEIRNVYADGMGLPQNGPQGWGRAARR